MLLLVYLGVMSYIGRGEFLAGRYSYYFGIIGATLAVIIVLHVFLRKRERMQRDRDAEIGKNKQDRNR